MRKTSALYLAGLMAVAICLFIVVEINSNASQAPVLKPGEAFALIQKNKGNANFVVLDVRTAEEFQTGHIEGAININLNSDAFREEIGRLGRDKTYLVYCRTGRRSQEAVRIMQDLGFTHLVRFEGDIVAWRAENLPLVN